MSRLNHNVTRSEFEEWVNAQRREMLDHRKCDKCGHSGIDDSDVSVSSCNSCDWSGPSPVEDVCPECNKKGSMSAACPKCEGLYDLIVEDGAATKAQKQECI